MPVFLRRKNLFRGNERENDEQRRAFSPLAQMVDAQKMFFCSCYSCSHHDFFRSYSFFQDFALQLSINTKTFSYRFVAFLLLFSPSPSPSLVSLTPILRLSTTSPLWLHAMSGWGTLQPRNTDPLAGDSRNSEEAEKNVMVTFVNMKRIRMSLSYTNGYIYRDWHNGWQPFLIICLYNETGFALPFIVAGSVYTSVNH